MLVPFLPQFYSLLPFSPTAREHMSSLYSGSQIVGGYVFGAASDAAGKSKRTTGRRKLYLLASFAASAASYGSVGLAAYLGGSLGLWIVVGSRLLVGFFKQTLTLTTSLLTSGSGDKTAEVGRISACLTLGWIVGPTLGR